MINLPSQKIALAAVVTPQNGNNATTLSGAVDMSKFRQALFIVQLGVVDQTVDFKLQEASTSGGSYTDISGKAITQLAATDDGKQAMINLRADELSAGKRYVKAAVTVANGTSSLVAVVCLGVDPVQGPASQSNATTVAQVVS